MKELWETPDSEFTSNERLFHSWYKRLRHCPKKYKRIYAITDKRSMEEHRGIKLEHTDNKIRASQPFLIERIIDVGPGMRKSNLVNHTTLPSVILTKDEK